MKIRAHSGTPDFDTETVQLLQIQWLYYKETEKGVFHKRRLLEEGESKTAATAAKNEEVKITALYECLSRGR